MSQINRSKPAIQHCALLAVGTLLVAGVLTVPAAGGSLSGLSSKVGLEVGSRAASSMGVIATGVGSGSSSSPELAASSGLAPASLASASSVWSNTTVDMARVGGAPSVSSAGLAYDPLLGAMVLFGGCASGQCPTNATWEYDGTGWANVTATLAAKAGGLPPALRDPGLAWDPQWAGVLLAGGELANGSGTNETWLLNSTGWHDLTATVNSALHGRASMLAAEAYGSMAYDGVLHEMVVVAGCTTTVGGCAHNLDPATFALGGPGSTWADVGTTFTPGLAFPGEGPGGDWAGEMAYDPSTLGLVYFGGENSTSAVQNSTWSMNASGWANVTASTRLCTPSPPTCDYPSGIAFGGMTWDGQIGEVVLTGGLTNGGSLTNGTYGLNNSFWRPTCGTSCSAVAPPSGDNGTISSNSSAVAPLLLEGECATACRGSEWAFDVPPEPVVRVVFPNPSELGVPVSISGTTLTGTGSGPVVTTTLFDGNGATNISTVTSGVTFGSTVAFAGRFSYATTGRYEVTAREVDFFDVQGVSLPDQAEVNATLSAAPLGTPDPTEVGTPVNFSAGTSGGVPPFSFAWQFGDGTTGTGSSPSHAYAMPGNYSGWVVVNDSLAVVANDSFTVVVYPTLSVEVAFSATETDAGFLIDVGAVPSGGDGTYVTYHWTFGDHQSASGRVVPHAWATAGNYTVTANVTDSAGFTATGTAPLRVNADLALSSIGVSDSSPTTATAVTFDVPVHNGTPGYGYTWSFGDGTISHAAEPQHTFSTAGAYAVSVTVVDRAGGIATKHLDLTISRVPFLTWLFGPQGHDLGYYLILGAAAALGLGLWAFTVWRGRRRRAGEQPPPESASQPVPPPAEDAQEPPAP